MRKQTAEEIEKEVRDWCKNKIRAPFEYFIMFYDGDQGEWAYSFVDPDMSEEMLTTCLVEAMKQNPMIIRAILNALRKLLLK